MPSHCETGRISIHPKFWIWHSHSHTPSPIGEIWYARLHLWYDFIWIDAPCCPCVAGSCKFDWMGTPFMFTDQREIRHATVSLWVCCFVPNLTLLSASCHPYWIRTHTHTAFRLFQLRTAFTDQGEVCVGQWICCLRLHTKFHMDQCIVSSLWGYKPQSWLILEYFWLPITNQFTDRVGGGRRQFGMHCWTCVMVLFHCDHWIMSPLQGEKLQIWPNFECLETSISTPFIDYGTFSRWEWTFCQSARN